MTYVANYMTPPPKPPGTAGLLVFGIISIVIGSLAGCTAMLLPMTLVLRAAAPSAVRAPAQSVASIIVALVVYVVMATLFIWTGIGSCKCRRWVRPVVLSVAWPWMVIGVITCLMFISMGKAPMTAGPGAPPQMQKMILAIMGVMMATMYIVLPSSYIVYYQRRSVQATLDLCDSGPSWTDRCPLPVLGLAIWLVITGVSMLSSLQFMCVPMFGIYVTGLPAGMIVLMIAALVIVAAWACYHTKPIGWWMTMGVLIVGASSAFITFSRTGIMEFYRRAHLPAEQIDILDKQPMLHGPMPLIMMGIFAAATMAYLSYVRRFFARPAM